MNIITEIVRPMHEENDKKILELQEELATRKAEYEDSLSEKNEIIDNMQCSIDTQISFLDEVLFKRVSKEKGGWEYETDVFTVADLADKLKRLELRPYERDYNVLSGMSDILMKLEPRVVTETVEVIPNSIKTAIRNLNEMIS